MAVLRADRQGAAGGHRVHGVEHQILQRAMQQLRIGLDQRHAVVQKQFRSDRRPA